MWIVCGHTCDQGGGGGAGGAEETGGPSAGSARRLGRGRHGRIGSMNGLDGHTASNAGREAGPRAGKRLAAGSWRLGGPLAGRQAIPDGPPASCLQRGARRVEGRRPGNRVPARASMHMACPSANRLGRPPVGAAARTPCPATRTCCAPPAAMHEVPTAAPRPVGVALGCLASPSRGAAAGSRVPPMESTPGAGRAAQAAEVSPIAGVRGSAAYPGTLRASASRAAGSIPVGCWPSSTLHRSDGPGHARAANSCGHTYLLAPSTRCGRPARCAWAARCETCLGGQLDAIHAPAAALAAPVSPSSSAPAHRLPVPSSSTRARVCKGR